MWPGCVARVSIFDIRSVPYKEETSSLVLCEFKSISPASHGGEYKQTQIRKLFTFSLQLFHQLQNNSRLTIAEKEQALLYDSAVRTHNASSRESGCISFNNCLQFSVITTKIMLPTQNTGNILKSGIQEKRMFSEV